MYNMFDENFSFHSSRVEPAPINLDDYTSAETSPFNSRCPSPKYTDHHSKARRQSAPRRDSPLDGYRPPRHPSVTALTAQLEHHAIHDISRPESPMSMASPDSLTDHDEGFYDGPETPSTNYSDDSDFDPTLWDLSMSNMGATSSPRPSLSLEAQALSSYTQRRRQRQALVRLQCLAKRAPDIAMLIEECHPSSLPLTSESLSGKSRSNSTISLGPASNSRVEKAPTAASVRKQVRIRKRSTR
jgi:hypothetical protein